MAAARRIAGTALIVGLGAGCSGPSPSARAECVSAFLSNQDELSHGIAVFDDVHGDVTESSGDLVARYRLSTGRLLQAASLSKPIAASDIRKLVENSRIGLDETVVNAWPQAHLQNLDAVHGAIRIRHLLQHSAGFDRAQSGDPLWTVNFPDAPQANCRLAAGQILQRRLDFAPGQRVAYSNAGYCLLGEILLAHGNDLTAMDRAFLESPLGAAGGWVSTPAGLHARLTQTLPLIHLEGVVAMRDGSHYDYGWRHWPHPTQGAEWTHFGRLPGMLSIAVTDGRNKLLVAYFDGDPRDVDGAALNLAQQAWTCMHNSQ